MGVTERIGEEYKQWQRGEIVYISAPTGSGKTEFILDTLLNYAIENNRAILYLVNRQILKAQLLERINSKQNQRVHNGKYVDVKNYIFVETYQALENINAINQNYFYIVADECHYGYCDSLFNPNTFLSYNLIISAIETCRIFISATMENMKNYIDLHIPDYKNMYQSNIFRFTRWKTWSYEIKAEYNHINLKCVNDMGELEQIIENEKGNKWLIFTDQKEKGKELRKNLQDKKCDVIYYDAESEEGSAEAEVINEIVKKQKTKKKIIITTSVMDNGISISDSELCNIVVMADTPEEFLQMLGRKRIENTNEKINLYVMKKSLSEFETRKTRYIDRLLKTVNRFNINGCYYCDAILRECLKNPSYYEDVSKICYIYWNSSINMNVVSVSPFSYNQLLYLSDIYREVIDSFKEGDDFAFLRLQAQWLGITDVDAVMQECIDRKVAINKNMVENELERLYQLCQDNADMIDEIKHSFYINKIITKEEIAEYKKKVEVTCKELLNTNFVNGQIKYAGALKELLSTLGINFEDEDWKDVKVSLDKHRLTDENLFSKAMLYAGLSYRLKKTNLGTKSKGGFTIYEIEKVEI